jgi:UDP-2,3-diacylglucosamine pyrophosphatase LpxH
LLAIIVHSEGIDYGKDNQFEMGRQNFSIPLDNRGLVVVADSHLESVPFDVECMIEFVKALHPDEHVLLYLGDLFHIWTESSRYHTTRQQQLLNELIAFRRKGGTVLLTVGNRDLFFEDQPFSSAEVDQPFDAISRGSLSLCAGKDLILAHHGDTVSRSDSAYLFWRKFIRSSLIKFIFNLIPAEQGKKLLFASEKRIKKTNQKFRICFPEKDWRKYIETYQERCAPHLLLVGHFHPKEPIVNTQGSTTGIVVPSWHMTQTYIAIDAQLRFQVQQFT